jgi:hypothetical protein
MTTSKHVRYCNGTVKRAAGPLAQRSRVPRAIRESVVLLHRAGLCRRLRLPVDGLCDTFRVGSRGPAFKGQTWPIWYGVIHILCRLNESRAGACCGDAFTIRRDVGRLHRRIGQP